MVRPRTGRYSQDREVDPRPGVRLGRPFGVLTVAAAWGYGRTLTPLSALALERREVLLAALAES